MKIRRINLLAGPGVGKTNSTATIFAKLDRLGLNIEQVDEHVKSWAYEGKQITKYDQLYLFSKQIRKETIFLNNGANMIITDSSPLLAVAYSIKYGANFQKELINLYKSYEADFPSIDIYLGRPDGEYAESGRYESKEEAQKMDSLIKDIYFDMLKKSSLNYINDGHNICATIALIKFKMGLEMNEKDKLGLKQAEIMERN